MSKQPLTSIHWRHISKRDLPLLKAHYLTFEPYSDFNTTSLWGYMGTKAAWAQYGDAFVFKLVDYQDNSEYFSVIGRGDTRDALAALAHNQKVERLALYNVPEVTMEYLKGWTVTQDISEDHANHDYVFAAGYLARMEGGEFKGKRKLLRQTTRRHPNLHIEIVDHRLPKNRRAFYRLFRTWAAENQKPDYYIEYAALKRALSIGDETMVCIAAYDGTRLVGFTINELDGKEYYQAHYGKTRHKYKGLSFMLEHHTARIMHDEYGAKYMNLQQDLGISGLSEFKQSLGECKLLKKYTVTLDFTKLS